MTFRTASLCLTVGLAAAIQGATPAPAAAQDKQPYVIYLSNNFVGNDWRQQMQRVAEVSVSKGPLEGRVVGWLKAEGDRVTAGELVAEIETDKAVVEVEAPADGTLVAIDAPVGATVPMGGRLGRVRRTAEV